MRRHLGFAVAAIVTVIALVVWQCGSADRDDDVHEAASQATNPTKSGAKRAKQAATLSGRVTSKADGRPIQRASVAINPEGDGEMVLAFTDEHDAWSKAVTTGRHVVAVVARGFRPDYLQTTVSSDGATVGIALEPGGTIVTGVVTDIGGGTIANVQIEAIRGTGATTYATFATVSDGVGRYELTLGPGSHSLVASHEDYVADSHYVVVPSIGRLEHDFQLTPGGVVRGQVVTESGVPVPEARVEVSSGRDVVADADGKFEVRAVKPGICRVRASARRFRSPDWTEVPVGLGEHIDGIRLVVLPAFVISGRTVVKGRPSEPVANARVATYGLVRSATQTSTRGDADGTFELQGIAPGPYFVGVWDDDVSVHMPYDLGSFRIDVVDRDITGVTLELELGVRVTGRVEPPMEASIKPSCRILRVETNPTTGAFVAEHMPTGTCDLSATGADGWEGKASITIGERGEQDVAIKLAQKRSIRGRVVSSEGKPIRDAYVNAPGQRDSEIRDDGTFRIWVSEPKTYHLTASYRDDQDSVSTDVTFTGTDVEGVTLTLPARKARLRGTVVDSAGKPVADARVGTSFEHAGPETNPELSKASTAEDGTFVLEGLRPGRYRVVATAANGISRGELIHVELDSSPRIVLTPFGSIRGRVTAEGTAVTSYEIRCGDAGRRTLKGGDGSYLFAYVAPGKYECHVDASAGTASGTVEVTTAAATLDLAIESRGTITGTFVDILTGEPVPNIYVLAVEPGILDRALAGYFQPTNAAGRFRVEVATGERDLFVSSLDTRRKSYQEGPKMVVRPGVTLDLGIVEGIPPHVDGTIGINGPVEGGTMSVTSVKPGSPGERAGIRVGDVVTAIHGRPIKTIELWSAFGVGQTYRLTLARGPTVNVVAAPW